MEKITLDKFIYFLSKWKGGNRRWRQDACALVLLETGGILEQSPIYFDKLNNAGKSA